MLGWISFIYIRARPSSHHKHCAYKTFFSRMALAQQDHCTSMSRKRSRRSMTTCSSPTSSDNDTVYIALGSNLGDRAANLHRAVTALKQHGVGEVKATSGFYESKAQYVTNQPDFLNVVCRLRSRMDPEDMLRSLKTIEKELGRIPSQRFGPRAIDLDIVLWGGGRTVNTKGKAPNDEGALYVPHIRLQEREFVLRPLSELDPHIRHPISGQSVQEMLTQCESSRSSSEPPLIRVLALPRCRLLALDPRTRTCIMGILNVTPDSFSDGGKDRSHQEAVGRALQMVEEGCHLIDIGGESTRPGAAEVLLQEEMDRVLSVIEGIRKINTEVAISIDTRRAAVAEAAIQAGADIVNDVSGGTFDPLMLPTVARLQVPIILMHMRGTPATMNSLANYQEHVVQEVTKELQATMKEAQKAGILRWALVGDPGIGFAKNLGHNLALLKDLHKLVDSLQGIPLLVGASRKRFIGTICDKPVAAERDVGTAAAHSLAVMEGASMIRVHNVPIAVDSIKMVDAIRLYQPSSGEEVRSNEKK